MNKFLKFAPTKDGKNKTVCINPDYIVALEELPNLIVVHLSDGSIANIHDSLDNFLKNFDVTAVASIATVGRK